MRLWPVRIRVLVNRYLCSSRFAFWRVVYRFISTVSKQPTKRNQSRFDRTPTGVGGFQIASTRR